MTNNAYSLKVAVFCGSLIVICYAFLRMTWAVFMTPLWETICIAVLLFFFLHINAIKSYILNLPKPIIGIFAVFYYIIFLGHSLCIPRTTFPFIPWQMFSDETRFSNTVNFYRYEGATLKGRKVSLKPEIFFRSLSNGRIVTDLDNLLTSIVVYNPTKEKDDFRRLQNLLDDSAQKHGGFKGLMADFRRSIFEENLFSLDEKKKNLNAILEAIAARYDQWHPDDPLQSIDVFRGTIDISKGNEAKESLKNVWHLSFR